MKQLYTLLFTLIISFTVNAQIIDIPDANFKNALVNTNCGSLTGSSNDLTDVDTNDDGEIQVSEAEAILYLNVSNQNIASLEGIEAFINLTGIDANNNQLNALNISTLNELGYLDLGYNLFTVTDNIIFPTNPISNYFALALYNNLLTTVNNLPSYLSDFTCDNNNPLTSLDLSGIQLFEFHCNDNPNLTSLVFTNSYIYELRLNNIGVTELDLSELNPASLYIRNNANLTFVQLGKGSPEQSNYIEDNPVLETISFKNGFTNYSEGYYYSYYSICNNPNLAFVCADENEIENFTFTIWEGETITLIADGVQQIVDNCGYTNVAVSSYCSFVPGGEVYTIKGDVKIDLDANGCDTNDAIFPNLNFSITNGTETGNFIPNGTGDYSIPVGDGTHTITPILENSDYFIINPTSLTVDFPTDTSPFIQNFCVTPNGTHNDLEITLIPIEFARPGFDTNYKLIYKNKGTSTLSGSVDLAFQDEFMDFVSALPAEDTQSANLLTWNFSDLTPFESREINLVLNLNAPTEIPPLNDGDILTLIASISSTETDETPDDNTSTLNQTVVNSFDPNDKTCLEGDFITPEMVGEYVHYMIRFENTGSASAVNIVVKDSIDTSKYDLATLVPLHASHNFITRINSEDDYVEFIFENINLPFDDANNDGYVSFKIKTLDTLVLGDTFENTAEIYFDFNFPIVTNTTQTAVATLSTEEFELANNTISLYPNPTTHILYIESKQAIKQVSIYDISGRSIKEIAVIGSKTDINISTESLDSGTYFVKIKRH